MYFHDAMYSAIIALISAPNILKALIYSRAAEASIFAFFGSLHLKNLLFDRTVFQFNGQVDIKFGCPNSFKR